MPKEKTQHDIDIEQAMLADLQKTEGQGKLDPRQIESMDIRQEDPTPEPQDTGELPDVTVEFLKDKSPQEIVDILVNSKKAVAASTKKYMEAAELRKQAQEEREQAKRDREYNQSLLTSITERQDKMIESLATQRTQTPTPTPTPIPDFNEDPAAGLKYLADQLKTVQGQLTEKDKLYNQNISDLKNNMNEVVGNLMLDRYVEKNIKPKYKYATTALINDFFKQNPHMKVDDSAIEYAARTIHESEKAKLDTRWDEYKKEKLADLKSTGDMSTGDNVGKIKRVKGLIDRDETEQERILEEDLRQILKEG